jgi:hypothetical protein
MPFTSAGAPIRESGKAILQGATDGMMEKPRKNTDPITGEPGAHPVGAGVGAAGGAITGAALGAAIGGPIGAAVGTVVGGVAAAYGAHGVAEAMNPTTQEEKYWREHHEKQPFVKAGYTTHITRPRIAPVTKGFTSIQGRRTKKSKAIWRSTTSEIKPNRRFHGIMLGTRCTRPGPNSAMI